MMIESHFSQLAESPAHVARWPSRIPSALGISPPAVDATAPEDTPRRKGMMPALAPLTPACHGRAVRTPRGDASARATCVGAVTIAPNSCHTRSSQSSLSIVAGGEGDRGEGMFRAAGRGHGVDGGGG
jgi:hypothetical protein